MFKKGSFKEGDIVKYVGKGGSEFYVKVSSLRPDVSGFAGEVVYVGNICDWDVGYVANDWWVDEFALLVEGYEHSVLAFITHLQQENTELEDKIKHLEQRLIEAERNALYWTAFDCPVNRDIAERILRKEN